MHQLLNLIIFLYQQPYQGHFCLMTYEGLEKVQEVAI